ncbi:hypothetical protein OIU74_016454, partial [Salix koriyanagi]
MWENTRVKRVRRVGRDPSIAAMVKYLEKMMNHHTMELRLKIGKSPL